MYVPQPGFSTAGSLAGEALPPQYGGIPAVPVPPSFSESMPFFEALVLEARNAFGVKQVMVSELCGSKLEQTRVIAAAPAEHIRTGMVFTLAGTPCAETLCNGQAFYDSGIQQRFPQATTLAALGAHSYYGVCLHNRNGQPLGLLSLFHDAPLERTPQVLTELRVLATCASAELERLQREQDRLLRQQALCALAAERSAAEERERRRIAIELHDRITQSLAYIKMLLQHEKLGLSKLSQAMDELDRVISDTRTLTIEISPPMLYELGLAAALEWLAEQTTARHSVPVELSILCNTAVIPEPTRVILFQFARELLQNAGKHAQASRVLLELRTVDGFAELSVSDDGRGCNPSALSAARVSASGAGFGLYSLRERAGYLNGSIDIVSRPGQGTRVSVRIPLDSAVAPDAAAAVSSAGREAVPEDPLP